MFSLQQALKMYDAVQEQIGAYEKEIVRKLPDLLCPLLTSLQGQSESLHPQSRFRDPQRISRGKTNRLPRTTAGSTTSALDGYGLRYHYASSPGSGRLPIRFLSIGSRVCSALPSDPTSRSAPSRFSNRLPPSGSAGDSRPQALDHARHTQKRAASLPPWVPTTSVRT